MRGAAQLVLPLQAREMIRRGGRAAEGARLESVYTATYRGFESHPLRQTCLTRRCSAEQITLGGASCPDQIGELAERLKAPDSKSGVPVRVSGVRIPRSPPIKSTSTEHPRSRWLAS